MPLLVRMQDDWHPVPFPECIETQATRVFHYTSASGLLGILESRTLWASSPLALNDLSELTYAVGLVRSVWDELKSKEGFESCADAMDLLLSRDGLERMKESVYILSASKNGDLLNQWQGYAGERGYAIGVSARPGSSLQVPGFAPAPGVLLPAMGQWSDVMYQPAEQRKAVVDLIEFAARTSMWHLLDFSLARLIPTIKNPAFAVEEEVRLVCTKVPGLEEGFRAGRFGVVPFVKLATARDYHAEVGEDGRPLLPLPIEALICGPSNDSERGLVLAAAKRLLMAHGYGFEPEASRIPYRT